MFFRRRCQKTFERNGSLEGMTFEGVVCKGNNPKRPKHVISFKIKNQAWIDKLKSTYGDDEAKFLKLV